MKGRLLMTLAALVLGPGAAWAPASVTREQMGVFISVTFGLALYGL